MLELRGAAAGYGETVIVRNVSVAVRAGQTVAVVGPNGAGKSTLIRALCGLLPLRSGTRIIDGADATKRNAHAIARSGICHIPEGRGVFPGLTVRDNLLLFAGVAGKHTAVDRSWTPSPSLPGISISEPAACPAGSSRCSR